MIIGIIGLSGSGKDTVSEIIRKYFDYQIINLDKIGHTVLKEKSKEIINIFGQITDKNNNIDRKKLGKIVFKNKNKLKLLNKIIHPHIKSTVLKQINYTGKNTYFKTINKFLSNTEQKFVIQGSVIHQIGLIPFCHMLFFVSVTNKILIERIKKRNPYLSKKYIKDRLNSQNFIKYYKKKSDIILNNNRNFDILELNILKLKNLLLKGNTDIS